MPVYYSCYVENTVIIQVRGRANMLNCDIFRELVQKGIEKFGLKNLVVDLEQCEGMDSTMVGILVGFSQYSDMKTIIVNIHPRHSALFNSLGVLGMLHIKPGKYVLPERLNILPLPELHKILSEKDRLRMILEAHQQLIDANKDNEVLFKEFIEQATQEMKNEQQKS